jgi:FlaA1/EpsC-like NDP-sugar epimerase
MDKWLLSLPRVWKRGIALICDAIASVSAMLVAFYLRLGELPSPSFSVAVALALAPFVTLPIFYSFGLYRAVFRHAGAQAMVVVAYAVACAAIPIFCLLTVVSLPGVPRTIGIIAPIMLLLATLFSRLVAREWLGGSGVARWSRGRGRVGIFGAGATGRQLASALSTSGEMIVSIFIDDDPALQGQTLNGIPIRSFDDAEDLIRAGVLTDILLAMPSATRQRRNEIVARLRGLPVRVQTLPAVSDLAQGKIDAADLHELDIDDLLGRETVAPDPALLARNVAGKVVLVTGAGGSIGSELCRQIFALGPASLLLVDISEFALYQIHAELDRRAAVTGAAFEIIPLLASVRDKGRMFEIMDTWRPETVYHAAAYKHVPLVEYNVIEGVLNNAFGTVTVADIAGRCGVRNFVLISTDKAVRPTNVMGATKRLAEIVLQAAALESGGTNYSMVRFGNVLNSSGSVVPLFRRQIAEGGPITVTHRDVTRYFMTISEAAQLVIQAGGMAQGGEVFMLDMGEPVKIYDLACAMIALSGATVRDEANPGGEISIEVVGLRPGEKLYEELLIGDNPEPTGHERIVKANEGLHFTPATLRTLLDELDAALSSGDRSRVRALLQRAVPEYQPDAKVVDWVYQQRSVNGVGKAETALEREERSLVRASKA